jgi:hypothetical protein
MERFAVTHIRGGLWSVAHQERTLSVYPTEEQALSSAFVLASQRNKLGLRTVISLSRETTETEIYAISDHRTCTRG